MDMVELKKKIIEDDKKKNKTIGVPLEFQNVAPIGIMKIDKNEEYTVGVEHFFYDPKEQKGYYPNSILNFNENREFFVYKRG